MCHLSSPSTATLLTVALFLGEALPGQTYRPGRETSPDWVVRQVFASEKMPSGDVLRWLNRHPLGDVDRDGCTDFSIYATLYPNSLDDTFVFVRGGDMAEADVVWPGLVYYDFAVLLNQGTSLTVVIDVGKIKLEAWSFPGMTFLGDIARPAAPPGLPRMVGFRDYYPGPDLNGDGADDLLFISEAQHWIGYTQKYVVYGAIDGVTYQALWQQYIPDLDLWIRTDTLLSPTMTDLNRDGTPDWFVNGSASHRYFYALSGVDGSILWTYDEGAVSLNGAIDRYINPSPDLDGDGIRDLVVMRPHVNVPVPPFGPHPGALYALSGADGSLIWANRQIGLLDHNYGTYGWEGSMRFWNAAPLGDMNRDGFPEIMILAAEEGTNWRRQRLLIFNGSDGTLLERQAVPETLSPYFPHDYLWNVVWTFLTLGDVDRDGYLELVFFPPSNTIVHSTGVPGIHAAIVGRKTLHVESTTHPGGWLSYAIDLPNAANCVFRAALSISLDWSGGGWLASGWDTFLAPGAVLNWSLANPSLSGVLDAQGFGGFQLRVPPSPNLVGLSIFARAIAEDPLHPGAIWTMTSLAETVVEP